MATAHTEWEQQGHTDLHTAGREAINPRPNEQITSTVWVEEHEN